MADLHLRFKLRVGVGDNEIQTCTMNIYAWGSGMFPGRGQ